MNKFFALSLLLLSPCVMYGMGKSAMSIQINDRFKSYAINADVEIKLPEHFKNRLVTGSQTSFTVNLEAKDQGIGYPIMGLYLNEQRKVEVYAGPNNIGKSQHTIYLSIDRLFTNDVANMCINILLFKKTKNRGLKGNDIKYHNLNNSLTVTMPRVGHEVDVYDEDFKSSDIQVGITPHAIGTLGKILVQHDYINRKEESDKYDDSVYENLKKSLEMNKEQLMLKMLSNEK